MQKLAWDHHCKAIIKGMDGQTNYEYFHSYTESLFHKPFDEFDLEEIDILCTKFEDIIERNVKRERNRKK